ncbi:MAG: M81 family metallopeptidase [Bryobacterales bacterium]|nr:M81 family metallopeptidase [Bryobacterales bacterium]
MARVGIAGFLHESNSFLRQQTSYEAFSQTSLTRGDELVSRWRTALHELGGMLAGAEEEGFEIVPIYATFAVPSGPIEAATYERIAMELADELQRAMPLGGLLLALHGATVAVSYPDADGEMLRRIREVVGPELPVVVTFDLHANISREMAERSTALIGYQTNPHLDQRERGLDAARLMGRILRGEVRPVQALESPPMLMQNSRQHTAAEPASIIFEKLREVTSWPGIVSASIAMGFPHSDVNEMGAHFVAVADGDDELARKAARTLAAFSWELRDRFAGNLPSVESSVAQARRAERTPVVLLDVGDNVGGGSAANSTVLYQELLRQDVRNGLIVLCDPAGVDVCVWAGVRNAVTVTVGDPPVTVTGRVRTLHDGMFEETQVRHGGWSKNDQGITAVIETAEQHTVVLTSRRMAPFSLEQLMSLGIHPERKRALVVKGVIAPRAAYEPVAAEFILVDTPGATTDNPIHLPYRHRRKPLFPMEPEASY